VDVTSYINGEGTYSLALVSSLAKAVSYPSREAGSNRPELVIELEAAGSAQTDTPTNTPTATPTSTPTDTEPAGPTNTPTSTPTDTEPAGPTNTPTDTPTATDVPPSATPTHTSPAPQLLTFNPAADAYVNASFPDTNFGSTSILRTYGTPEQRSYLRFNISGLGGQVITRATLRLYANGSSSAGYTVSGVPDTNWAETTLTYNNMPPLGDALGSVASHGGGQYTSVDVTSYVTGEGTFAFALTTGSTKVVSYPSREAGSNRPELVLELAAAGSAGSAERATTPGLLVLGAVGLGPLAAWQHGRQRRRGRVERRA
jgi:hypothetical protein